MARPTRSDSLDILVRFPPHLAVSLDRLAEAAGVDKTAVIRWAVMQLAKAEGVYQPPGEAKPPE